MINLTALERFNNKWKLNPQTNCWEWSASIRKNGYGRFRYERKTVAAHRVSYLLHKGNIPKGMCVLHKCDNRRCVNPEHLFLGTQNDNMNDMKDKGRWDGDYGENHKNSKLTNEQVLAILSDNRNYRVIAQDYLVSKETIVAIKRKLRWKRITDGG